jgi:hypothetical protein
MLSIRTSTFESKENADTAISRLDWQVEKVERFTNPLLNDSTADTARPWVGKIDKKKKEFQILQTAPFFSPRLVEGNFFQLFVRGRIADEGLNCRIVLEFKLGLKTSLLFSLIYLFPVFTTLAYLESGSADRTGLVFSFVIPILFTSLLIVQLNRTENKLIDMFDV